jgi:hypothetical protein
MSALSGFLAVSPAYREDNLSLKRFSMNEFPSLFYNMFTSRGKTEKIEGKLDSSEKLCWQQ